MDQAELSRLPQIEKLLASAEPGRWFPRLSRPLVARLAAETVASFREALLRGEPAPPDLERAVLARLEQACRAASHRRLQRVINATGVLLHTNLGRAPLASEVWIAAETVNSGYSNLELDLGTGQRGRRGGLLEELLSLLTGAEAALVVNNNAAAVFLILSCLARRREVLVSRGEQVQIGGGFRIPEILELSGARLVEVGTTNVTTVEDYTAALGLQTALVLVVHSSNFRIRGFTESPAVESLARALPPDVPLVVDQGSGAISEELPGEQRVGQLLKAGAHLVCFSADKLLGGPQAGLIVGRRSLLEPLSRHPLNRVIRPGKAVLSLLEEFLVRRLNGELAGTTEATLRLGVEELRRRGRNLLRGLDPARARLVPSSLTPGGGSVPDESFPSLAIELAGDAQHTLDLLRGGEPPVIGIIRDGRVLLDLSTVLPEDLPQLRRALQALLPPA